MALLKKDSPPEVISAIQQIEDRADNCFTRLLLLRYPSNLAIWSLLAGGVLEVERTIAKHGDNSAELEILLANISRAISAGIKWVSGHGKGSSTLAKLRWTPKAEKLVEEVFREAHAYDSFTGSMPLWHQNYIAAELKSPTVVRFVLPESEMAKRVSAHLKGFRPADGYFKGQRAEKPNQTQKVVSLFQKVLADCRKTGPTRFVYEDPWDLWYALLPEYQARVVAITRRSESLSLGGFSLKEFNSLYSAFLTICAVHEYLCFCWHMRESVYPIDSAILIRLRSNWISTLSTLAEISTDKCDAIVTDLTFDPSNSVDLHVSPIVPLDHSTLNFAVAPHFPLHSRHDENILRICSRVRPRVFDFTSIEKESELRQYLDEGASAYRLQGPISMPQPIPDVDLLVTDEESSTIVISELKWIRKTMRSVERITRNTEVLKGVHQLEQIRVFLKENPKYLSWRDKLPKGIDEYANVYFLVVARDHFVWREPADGIAIIELEAFRKSLARLGGLDAAIKDLLKFDWLPKEGRDFQVKIERATVNDVSTENEVYYPIR